MTTTDDAITIEIKRDDLEHACRIVGEFRELLRSEIQEKHNLLLMSSTREGLGTVLGILSAALTGGDAGLAVADQDTRSRLSGVYAHLEAVAPNTIDGSPAQTACLQLQSAIYGILDMDYKPGHAQAAVENVMAAARFGSELAEALLDAGEDALEDCYLAKDGQKLTTERLTLAKSAMDALLPKYNPDQDQGGDENG